jgi:hypothetical protein
MHAKQTRKYPCGRIGRRAFLTDVGMGFTGLALASLLQRDAAAGPAAGESPPGLHLAPRAKRVIWYFMLGGTSHLESFDPKPEVNKHAGKTIAESPFRGTVLDSPYYRKNVRDFAGTPRGLMATIYPLQVGYRPRGQSGIEVSDWWQHVGDVIDDIAVVRSMWTTDNDHAAQLQFHTGRHIFDGFHPSIGSWVHYGLGSLNDNLPQFVVLGPPPGDCCGGIGAFDGSYLGPEHSAVPLALDPANPLPFGTPGAHVTIEERRQQVELLKELGGLSGIDYPDDPALRARIKSYELAFRMQLSVPELVRLGDETAATQELYGLNDPATQAVGRMSLVARRLVERGVRFVQIFDDGWDAHAKLKENHGTRIKAVDKPIAGLLRDLKQRGMLDETLVVFATEFGRTPGAERSDGRDHHPYGFSVWLAGGGIKGGVVHGSTDEIGFHAVENRHYVTDIHATLLHQLGLEAHRLEIPGHKRIEIDFGQPIKEIIA